MITTLIESIVGSTIGAIVSWWLARKRHRDFQRLAASWEDENAARAVIDARLMTAKTEAEREAAWKGFVSLSWETVPTSKRTKLFVRWVVFVVAWILFSFGLFAHNKWYQYKFDRHLQQRDEYVNQARLCQNQDKALQYYTDAITLCNKERIGLCAGLLDVIHFERGLIFYQKGLYVNAILDYDVAIKINARDSSDRQKQIEHDKTGADYDKVRRMNNIRADYYLFRGMAFSAKEDYNKAIADYDEAITLDNTKAEYYHSRGKTFLWKGDCEKAIADADTAIRLDNTKASYYDSRAKAYHSKGDYEKAIADVDTAIRMDNTIASYYHSRGRAYFFIHKLDKAIADIDAAIRLDNTKPEYYHLRGTANYAKNNLDTAITDYTQAIYLDSKFAPAYLGRSSVHKHKGNLTQANADYQQAIAIDPKLAKEKLP